MKLQLQPQLIQPAMKQACFVLDRLLQAGFSAFFVGGSVRDTLLQLPIHDIDITTSARPEQVMEVFQHCIPTGLQHGTVTVIEHGCSYEITTFRTESGYDDYRRPSQVTYVTELHLDLMRRDFTMNAMAIDREGVLIDPFGGCSHLEERRLVTVGISEHRFQEDALRMLRGIRFAATYELAIDSNCWSAILSQRALMKHIAMERIAYELGRLLEAKDPNSGIQRLLDSGLLRYCKKKLGFAEAILKDRTSKALYRQARFAYFFHSLGVSSEEAVSDMYKLRLSKAIIYESKHMLELQEWLDSVRTTVGEEWTENVELHNNKTVRLPHTLALEWLDKLLKYPMQHIILFTEVYEDDEDSLHKAVAWYHKLLPIVSPKQLNVRGNELVKWLEKPSGPWVKRCLDHIFLQVASGKLHNEKQDIKSYILKHVEGGEGHEFE